MRFFLAFLGLAAALVAEPPKELSDKQKLEVARFQAGIATMQLEATRRIEELKAQQAADLQKAIEQENGRINQTVRAFSQYLDVARKELGIDPQCAPDANQKFVCPDKTAVAKK